MMDLDVGGKKLHRLIDVHGQHVSDTLALVAYRQGLLVKTESAAALTGHLDVREEAHPDLAHTLAFANVTAPPVDVEGEPPRLIAAHPRLGRVGEQPADVVPEPHVGRGARARRLADGCLLDFQHAPHRIPAGDVTATPQPPSGSPPAPLPHQPVQVLVQHVAHQRALAAATHPRHAHELAERQRELRDAQVVQCGVDDPECRASGVEVELRGAAGSVQGMGHRVGQATPRHRPRIAQQLFHLPLGDHPATVHARARAEVDDVIRAPDRVLVVLDHHHGVALALELAERVQQHAIVPGVQADGGLVEDVAHAAEIGAELRSQPDALGIAPAQRRRSTVQRQIGKAHLFQES